MNVKKSTRSIRILFSLIVGVLLLATITVQASTGSDLLRPVAPISNDNDLISVYKMDNAPNITDGLKGRWTDVPFIVFNATYDVDSVEVKFYTVHDGNRIYFAFEYYDPTVSDSIGIDGQTIIMDTDEDSVWEQFNGDLMDQVVSSWYVGQGHAIAYDRYWMYPTIDDDTNDGGETNVEGKGLYNFSTGMYFFEASQELDSTDDSHDMSLIEGDSFLALISIYKDNIGYNGLMTTLSIESSYLDTASPEINIDTPDLGGNYGSSTVDVVFSISETADWMGYSLDGQVNQTVTGNFSLFNLAEGVHTLRIYANDSWGNMGMSETVSFDIDFTPPTINILTPLAGTLNSTSFWLNFSVSEPVSWIGYRIDAGVNITTVENSIYLTLDEGDYQIDIFANDTAGNTGTASVNVTISGTIPKDNTTTSNSDTNTSVSENTTQDSTTTPSSSTQTSTNPSDESDEPSSFINPLVWHTPLILITLIFSVSIRKRFLR